MMALLHAKGELAIGEDFVHEGCVSLTLSLFCSLSLSLVQSLTVYANSASLYHVQSMVSEVSLPL